METLRSRKAALILLFFAFVQSNAIMPKPGDPRGIGDCLELCSRDSDCPGDDQICCFNGCGHVCMTQTIVKPGKCPDDFFVHLMPICGEMCSSDSDCPFGEKCCDNGCGHVCLSHELVKPGSCPLILYSLRCFDHCRGDSSCSNELKCCPTICGFKCVEPIF
uniref:WAP domain-containing protein n=1 Tax=Nothobranchius furzeri TaxID=105023 RepID=A0A8C6PG00_NOTFU